MKNILYKLLVSAFVLASSHSLYAHVELDNPKGGETFVSGTTVTIQWHISIVHVTLNWDLLYSLDGGATWEYIQEDIPTNQLSFQWHVPAEATSQGRISIIQDNQGQDYQDESTNFTIQSTTSIPTIPESYLQLFPNPVNDILTVDLSNNTYWPADLKFFDATGHAVLKVSELDKVTTFSVNSFAAGFYLLQIKTPQGITTRKVFIQK
ncbi:MAG TPA: T9SS type A sorting domain-containing protein [Saprospiraceae bacterium]|nr:T9SS type A sorting domain-containing protein [Saprospiraceae bacterium]